MRRLLVVLAALLFATSAGAQQTPVKQTGGVTFGHPAMWTTNGVIQDAGPAVTGFLTGVGVIAQGPGICQISAPTSGPYQQLCLSTQTNGPAQIILQNFGGAPAQPLQFVVNGVVQSVGGAITSVSNVDNTLTINPTTGAVIASLNRNNANTWLALQTFSSGFQIGGKTATAISGNTNTLLSVTGSVINGGCASGDSNGNIIFGGGSCVSSSSGVTAGTSGQAAYYASTGSVVSGTSVGALSFTAPNGSAARTISARSNDYGVNILDFGADPTGSADSTNAIQNAIDTLTGGNGGTRTVFCPDGNFKTTRPIFLDPPENLRGANGVGLIPWSSGGFYPLNYTVDFNGLPYISLISNNNNHQPDISPTQWRPFFWNSGTTYANGDMVTYTADGNPAHAVPFVSLSNSNLNNTPSTSSTFWRATVAANGPRASNFGYTFTGTVGVADATGGCALTATFDNAVLFYVGVGNGMMARGFTLGSNISVPDRGWGIYPSTGIGICIAGDGGGANRTTIENTLVQNISTAYQTGCNSDGLGAENTFFKVFAANCNNGIYISQQNNFINHVIDANIQCTNAILAFNGPGISIDGGNYSFSGETVLTNLFNISGTTNFTLTGDINSFGIYTFQTTIASPDTYITSCGTNVGNCVYTGWVILTPHFGPVPIQMTAWNSGTNVATFQILNTWAWYYFGVRDFAPQDMFSTTDIVAELTAATQAYAVQRTVTFSAAGIDVKGVHVEVNVDCKTFFNDLNFVNADKGSIFSHVRFNYPIGMSQQSGSPGTPNYGSFLCQNVFPFIQFNGGGSGNVKFEAMVWGDNSPVVLDNIPGNNAFKCEFDFPGVGTNFVNPSTRVGWSGTNNPIYFPTIGGCHFNYSPFVPYVVVQNNNVEIPGQALTTPFIGYRPNPAMQPRLTTALYSTLQSIAGTSFINYPPINGSSIYSVLDWLTPGAPAAAKLAQSLHNSFSWGQNLTTSNIPGLSWSYKGGSCMVLADSGTLGTIFPGLGITLDNGSGPTHYVVTGVYPFTSLDSGTHPGYFTIMQQNGGFGGSFCGVGTKTVVYNSGGIHGEANNIGQDSYNWKTLTLQ